MLEVECPVLCLCAPNSTVPAVLISVLLTFHITLEGEIESHIF